MSEDVMNENDLSNDLESEIEQSTAESGVKEELSTEERIARMEAQLKKSQKTQKNYRNGINRVHLEKDQLKEELAALKAQNEQLLTAFQQSGQQYYAQQQPVDVQTQLKSWVKEAITDNESQKSQQSLQERQKKEWSEVVEAFHSNVELARDKYDDYEDCVPYAQASQSLQNELVYLPNTGFVQYALAKNPKVLAEFNQLPELKLKRELLKFARKCEGWDDTNDYVEVEPDSQSKKVASNSGFKPVGSRGKPVRISKKDYSSMSYQEKVDFLGLPNKANR